jgi:hypothetical protein
MKRLAAAVLACAALLLPAAAHAQDAWDQQVRTILQGTARIFQGQGFTQTHQIMTGSLNQGADETVEVTLQAGKEYHIMGACDTDCSDMDLTLFDASGTEVDSDMEEDSAPIVSVRVQRTGTYRVKVDMAACSAGPCRYGLSVFGK